MKASLFVVIGSLAITLSFAQKSPLKFGDVSMDELTMSSCAIDSSAAAVILSDYGEAYLQITSITANLTFERHVRIKVLKKDGLKWANASIPLYYNGTNEERVTGLKAASYHLEGGEIVVSKMSKDGVFEEKFNTNFNVQKFTIPNVTEGSVIEYTYKVVSDFVANFPNWRFQSTIPTLRSEYWAIIPEFFVFEKYMQGYVPVTNYEAHNKSMAGYNAKAHHWVITDVQAFKEEPYMTSEEDYISKMNFALSYIQFPGRPMQEIMGSWAKLNENLLKSESFGTVIERSGFLKKKVEELVGSVTDPMEKISILHSYVKSNIEWDGFKDFAAVNLKKIIDEKKGSSGDINLLLGSMLDKAGLNVNMVLLSTRDHGFIRESFPMQRQFNYTVCQVKVGEQTLLLDATDKYLPFTVLPDRCLNGRGMVVASTGPQWISLETKAKAKTSTSVDLKLSEDGELTGKLSMTKDGYDAHTSRKSFFAKGESDYLKELIGRKMWTLENSSLENMEKSELPVKESHNITIREHALLAGETMYINPFVTGQLEKNPFASEKREYPVDFGPRIEKIYLLKVEIPEGFVLDEAPPSKVFITPGNSARYIYSSTITGNTLNITSQLQINRNIFGQYEYPILREFYDQVVAKQAEQIVLKKK